MLKYNYPIDVDEVIWNKFLAGDDKAYAYIYKTYISVLFAYGMRFTSNREIVKDCIQDVFVRLYKNRKHLSPTDNIKFYLFIALKNTLYNVFQKDSESYSVDSLEPVYYTDYTIETQIIENENEKELKEKMIFILELLTPRQREAIYYRYVEEMSLKEICRLMNMNPQSVQNLIQRSIKKVRKMILKSEYKK